eukprot:CFRG7614T1
MSQQVKKQKMSLLTIGTHNGTFHADEALACFLLHQTEKYANANIVRSRDPEKHKECDILVDVGAVYDPERNTFDHHQRTFDTTFNEKYTTKLSSAGLIYKHFGKEVVARMAGKPLDENVMAIIYDKMYSGLIHGFDAVDNGVSMYPAELKPAYQDSTHISGRVSRLNPAWNDTTSDVTTQFMKAVALTGEEFTSRLRGLIDSWLPARVVVENAIAKRSTVHESGKVLELETACPWKDHFFDLEGELPENADLKDVLYVIFPDNAGSWRVQGVPTAPSSFECRKFLPEEWRGIRDDALSALTEIDGYVVPSFVLSEHLQDYSLSSLTIPRSTMDIFAAHGKRDHTTEVQCARQRDNLVTALEACVAEMSKNFLAYAVEDHDELLWCLCDIIENCLTHGLKSKKEREGRWFGFGSSYTNADSVPMWEWISGCKTELAILSECCESINMMEDVRTAHGKGRVWMRISLMEKRLGEYVSACVYNCKDTTNSFYRKGAMMLNSQVESFLCTLDRLKYVDFNLVLKGVGTDLDKPRRLPTIDYSRFMRASMNGPRPEVRRKKSLTGCFRELNTRTSPVRKGVQSTIVNKSSPGKLTTSGPNDDFQNEAGAVISPTERRKKSLKILDSVTQLRTQLLAAGDQRVYLEGKLAEATKALEESESRHSGMLKDLEDTQARFEKEADQHIKEMKTMERIIVELQKVILELQIKVDNPVPTT